MTLPPFALRFRTTTSSSVAFFARLPSPSVGVGMGSTRVQVAPEKAIFYGMPSS